MLNNFARAATSVCLFVAPAIGLFGCSVRHDFVYETEKIEALPSTELRIAVLPFADSREKIDSGSAAWAYLPGVPTAANTQDGPQSTADRFRGEYYFPDLVAYGLVRDLADNRAGAEVHLNPEVTDDYDVVIDGSLSALARTTRKITYGLGFAAFLVHMVGLPPGSKAVDFVATYRVRKPSGEVLFEKPYESSWSAVDYKEDENTVPIMEGINSTIRENNTAFLEGLAPVLREVSADGFQTRRAKRYYIALDPELRVLDQRRIELIRQGRQETAPFRRVTEEMRKREKWLESYRQAENKFIAKQQQHLFQVQESRLQQIAALRQQKRAIESRQQQMEEQQSRAQKQALAGAIVAGVMPALQSANSLQGGHWTGEHTITALKDTASALSALPPPPPPPPDLTPYLSQLDVSFDGLESAGAGLFSNLSGASVVEIRQKFLDKYRRLITPASEI